MTLGTVDSGLPISPSAKAVTSERWLTVAPMKDLAEPLMSKEPRLVP